MAQDPNPNDLEARVAALEAKVHPCNVCMYADQEYTEGAVLVQNNRTMTCAREFIDGPVTWR